MSSEKSDTRTRILDATWQLLEQHRGQGVNMSDIAKAVGISRQAVYLHFASRSELMIATMNYVDEVKGLDERFSKLSSASNGVELLEACIDIWCNYIPEIYGLAKAMMLTRDSDEDMAAAWNNSMNCLRGVCLQTINTLEKEGRLATGWSTQQATDMFMTLISISNWEQLTVEYGWSNQLYIQKITAVIKNTLIG